MKKRIAVISMVALMLLVAGGCGCKNKDSDKNKKAEITANTNTNVIKEAVVDGLTINNVSLITENGGSSYNATVTNNSGATKTLQYIKIYVKASDGSTIITLVGYVGNTLENGAAKMISSECDTDLTNAASIEYEVVA